jgi:transforming growth factor-beta-induced protein
MLLSSALLSTLILTGSPDGTCQASKAAAKTVAWSPAGHDIVETAMGNKDFSTLVAAVKAAGLVEALQSEGPFTVFAPTNEAFAKLPEKQLAMLLEPENKALLQAILTYHVVPGKVEAKSVITMNNATTLNGQRVDFNVTDAGVTIDGASIIKTDIDCSNGVIHVIDTVIIPSTMDIVETAIDAGAFKTLAAALQAAQLVEALQGDGPFTVFAPTDEAFAALPKGTVETLLKPENKDQLTAILKYHVVSGRVYADAVSKGGEFATLQGKHLKTRSKDGRVMVNRAKVVKADIETSNGVIHVIDAVLIPE